MVLCLEVVLISRKPHLHLLIKSSSHTQSHSNWSYLFYPKTKILRSDTYTTEIHYLPYIEFTTGELGL